jgi:hypothetical protein
MPKKLKGHRNAPGHREASAKLATTLADVDFPVTKEELADRVGDARIPLDADTDITVREMLDHVREPEFKVFSKAQRVLNANWQAYRAAKGLQEPPLDSVTEDKARGR